MDEYSCIPVIVCWKANVVFAPSTHRKILNDLSSDAPGVPRIEEEKSEEDAAPAITTVTVPTPIYQTSSGQYSMFHSHW